MAKWHISKTSGQVGICRATKVACPVGEAGDHFPSEELAIKEYMHRDPKLAEYTKQWGLRRLGEKVIDRDISLNESELAAGPEKVSMKEAVGGYSEHLADYASKNLHVSTTLIRENPAIVNAAGVGIVMVALDSLTGGKITHFGNKLMLKLRKWERQRYEKVAKRIREKTIAHEAKAEGGLTPEQVDKGLKLFEDPNHWTTYYRGKELLDRIAEEQKTYRRFGNDPEFKPGQEWKRDSALLGVPLLSDDKPGAPSQRRKR